MTEEQHVPEHIRRLLVSSIESLDRLDILLHLRANSGRSSSAEALARTLHMTSAFVEQHLAVLCGRGFLTVSIGSDLTYAYQPTSDGIDATVKELDALNRDRREDLIALLDEGKQRRPQA